MRRIASIIGLSTLALLSIPGCGDDPPSGSPPTGADEYAAELFPRAKVLSAAAQNALTSFDPEGTLVWNERPAELAQVAKFHVLLSGPSAAAPDGFLRVIRSVEADGGKLVLRTAPAPIQLAFRKLHVKLQRQAPDFVGADTKATPTRPLVLHSGEGSKSVSIDFTPINGDGNPSTPSDQVHMKSLLKGGFGYTLSIDVDWGAVLDVPSALEECLEKLAEAVFGGGGGGCSIHDLMPEAKVGFFFDVRAETTLGMGGVSFLPYDAPFEIAEFPLPSFPIGPLWFFPAIKVKAMIGGRASSQFAFDMSAGVSADMGVSFSNKSPKPDVKTPTATLDVGASNVDATLEAGGWLEVGPELYVRLYKIAGPWAGVYARVDLDAKQGRDPCWELKSSLTSKFGVDLVTPDLPLIGHAELASFDASFPLHEKTAASGACKPLPGGGAALPTGGDPDAATFANPTFTPWSRTYSGLIASHPFEGVGAQIEWLDATPTIDGRFVISGSDTKALFKIHPDGTPVWAKRYVGSKIFDDTQIKDLLPGRIADMGDGTMLVLAHPYSLLKVEADGSVVWARRFEVPYQEETIRFTSLVPRKGGGFYVGGTAGEDRTKKQTVDAWVLRLDDKGNVVWSRRWGAPELGETLRALVPFEDGVVAAGATWIPSESRWRAWTTRLAADGGVVWSKSYDARECGSPSEASAFFTTGITTRDGDLVFAGSFETARTDTLVARLKPDGSLAWFASDGMVDPVNKGPAISRIVELPTTGFLYAGSLDYSEDGTYSASQDDLWLGAADGVGRAQWLRRYSGTTTRDGIERRSDTYGSFALTKDGAALLVGYTDTLTPEGKGLWAMKVPAKDGVLAFAAGSNALTGAAAFTPRTNCFVQKDWAIAPVAHAPALSPLHVDVENVAVAVHTQTP